MINQFSMGIRISATNNSLNLDLFLEEPVIKKMKHIWLIVEAYQKIRGLNSNELNKEGGMLWFYDVGTMVKSGNLKILKSMQRDVHEIEARSGYLREKLERYKRLNLI